MKASTILDAQRRAVHINRVTKSFSAMFRSAHISSTPILVMGVQRSGTSMLMNVLNLRSDTEVYDESKKNAAFDDFMLREYHIVQDLIRRSKAPFVCFKPLSDSHRASEILERFQGSKILWLYRNYSDVANSTLRKFPMATRAIKKVIREEEGGGWFAEGVTSETATLLRQMSTDDLSSFEYACLIWWARNRIVFEQGLEENSRVILINYEKLVTNPRKMFSETFSKIGMRPEDRALRFVTEASVGKHSAPAMSEEIQKACRDLKERLDQCAI